MISMHLTVTVESPLNDHELEGLRHDLGNALRGRLPFTAASLRMTVSDAKYTEEQVNYALNQAAEDISMASEADELIDGLNLMVNVTSYYLSHGNAGGLDEAIRDCYEAEPDEVRSWLAGC